MRCPCPCGCRAHAQGRPPSWCGALADCGRGQWRPPPPRWRCTQPSTAISHRWSSPLPSTRRCRLWDTTTWETCTRKTTESKGNEPLRSGRLPARVSPALGRGWPAIVLSWRPFCRCPCRGGGLRPRTRSRAPCPRTPRKWSSGAGWPRPPGWRPCTTEDIQSR